MRLIHGVVTALVTNVNDPLKQGRVKMSFRWQSETHETDFIRIATPMAGNGRGAFFMPEVGDQALVAFERGDVRFPYVIGFLYKGQDHPPTEDVRERVIQSVNGHRIRFLDSTPASGNKGALVIEDAHGNTIFLSNGQITIKATGQLRLMAPTVVINGRVVSPNPNPI